MRVLFAYAICLSLPAARGDDAADKKLAEATKAIQGKWVPERQQFAGKDEPEAEWVHLSWEFKKDKLTIRMRGLGGMPDRDTEWPYTIDTSRDPAHIDIVVPKNDKFGFIGVFKLDGDKLTVSFNGGRESRPKQLESVKGDVYQTIHFKRKK